MSFRDLVGNTIHKAVFSGQQLTEEAVYEPESGSGAFTIRGVWSGPHQTIDFGVPEYSTTKPSLDVRLSDFEETPLQGDSVTVLGTEYQVTDVQPHGQGLATLILRQA